MKSRDSVMVDRCSAHSPGKALAIGAQRHITNMTSGIRLLKMLGLDMEQACLNVIRDDKYKYVHFAHLPELLFDLESDPGELDNIAPDNPEIVARYAQQLLSWRMRTTDKTLSHYQISREHGLRDLSSGPKVAVILE